MLQTALEDLQQALDAESGRIRLIQAEEDNMDRRRPMPPSTPDEAHQAQDMEQDQHLWNS